MDSQRLSDVISQAELAGMNEQLKTTLRWIGVLPLAIIASILIQFVVAIGNYMAPDWICKIINSIASSYVFVLSGAKIAPKHNFTTAIILTGLNILATGMMLTISGQMLSSGRMSGGSFTWIIIAMILGIVGASAACFKVKEDEMSAAENARK